MSSPFAVSLASDTDWNGNRTIYKVDDRGRLIQRWDPMQVESIVRDLIPVGSTTAQITSFIRGLSLTDPVIAARFNGTAYDDLSYRYNLASPNRDTWGNVISGKDLGEPLALKSPDPDNYLLRDFPAADRTNGPQGIQTDSRTYTLEKNLATNQQPTLSQEKYTYNETFDIPTKIVDEVGTITDQSVTPIGLVNQRKITSVNSNSPGYNANSPYDVNADGVISSLDVLAITNAINQFTTGGGVGPLVAPAGPPFLDVDGNGLVTTVDSMLVTSFLNSVGAIPPTGSSLTQQTDYTFAASTTLPKGLVSEVAETTGRTDVPIIRTRYTYVDNISSPAHGKVLTVTEGFGSAIAATTTFAYDSRGRLSTVTDPVGRISKYYYDLLDRLVAFAGPDPDGPGPLLTPLVRYDFDAFDNVIATEIINSTIDTSVGNSSQLLITALTDGVQYNYQTRTVASYQQQGTTTWYLYVDTSGNMQRTINKATATAGVLVSNTVLDAYATANSVIENSPVPGTVNSTGVTAKYAGLVSTTIFDANYNRVSSNQQDSVIGIASNQLISVVYDRLDRPIEIIAPNPVTGLTTTASDLRSASGGYRTLISYDNLSNVRKVTDGLNNTTSFTYDSLNRIKSVNRPNGSTVGYAYVPDGSSWTVSTTDGEGRVISTRTDALGRTVKISGNTPNYTIGYYTDGRLKSVTNEASRSTQYNYDSQGRLTRYVDLDPLTGSPGSQPVTDYGYTLDGLLSSVTDPVGRISTYQYDAGGRRIKASDPDPDGAGPLQASYNVYRYDAIGNLTLKADALNDPSTITYAAANQPERIQRDARFRSIQSFDQRGFSTTRSYDNFNRVTAVIDPVQNTTKYAYNNLNQLVSQTQVVSSAAPAVNLTRSFTFDGVGNQRTSTDRNGRLTTLDYDNLYRLTRETWTTGASVNKTIDYTYDNAYNLLTVDDSDNVGGTDFQFAYDTRNQLQLERQTIPGLGSSVVLDRNYDSLGNRTKLSANFGGTIAVGSNLSSTSETLATGGVNDFQNTYSYDGLNRLSSVSQTSQTGTSNSVASKFVQLAYNAASQITDVRRYADTTANAANLKVASRYVYDGAARLASITHAKTEIAAGQSYNGISALPASLTPATTFAAYQFTYDQRDRLATFASYADAFQTTYAYSAVNEIASATSTAIAGLALPAALPVTETRSFDANGNRFVNNTAGQYSAPQGNQNRITNDGTNTFVYDNEGNTIQKTVTATGRVTLYTWDHRNRLTQVQDKVSAAGAVLKTVQYFYDAFDRRTIKQLDADGNGTFEQYTAYISDGSHEILVFQDIDGQGAASSYRLTNRILHGDGVDMVLADEQYSSGLGFQPGSITGTPTQGNTFWTLGDHLGSIRDVVDNNGITRQHLVFDSFGNRIREVDRNTAGTVVASTSAAAIDELFGYTGRDWDADIGLQYNRARWYDPVSGRWLSQDPIGFAGRDANLYRYVHNRSTRYKDSTGLFDEPPEVEKGHRKGNNPEKHSQAEHARRLQHQNALRRIAQESKNDVVNDALKHIDASICDLEVAKKSVERKMLNSAGDAGKHADDMAKLARSVESLKEIELIVENGQIVDAKNLDDLTEERPLADWKKDLGRDPLCRSVGDWRGSSR
jgi:RHS repeat-associated protein